MSSKRVYEQIDNADVQLTAAITTLEIQGVLAPGTREICEGLLAQLHRAQQDYKLREGNPIKRWLNL